MVGTDNDPFDNSAFLGGDGGLHFHRLQHDYRVALPDTFTRCNLNRDDQSGHGRAQVAGIGRVCLFVLVDFIAQVVIPDDDSLRLAVQFKKHPPHSLFIRFGRGQIMYDCLPIILKG